MEINMKIRIQKWGNSYGIRIPSNIIKSLNIKVNDVLDIEQIDKKIVISISDKNKISLSENLSKDFSWDESVGKEIW